MKFRSKTFYSFVILAIIYASINLLAAPPRTTLQKYNVSSTSLHLLNLTVVVPVVSIWFVALYGYQKLRKYTSYIQDNKNRESTAVLTLTRGIMILAYWLPINSTLSAILNLLARHHPALLPYATITINYLALLLPLIAILFISRGARALTDASKQRPPQNGVNIMAIVLIIAGVLYGYLVASARTHIDSIYHLPLVVVLLTLVVPYIFCWFLGLLAAYEIHLYTKKVRGVIYRKSWNALAFGIMWIILFSILLQYLTSVSAKLGNLSLAWLLVLIYTILPVMAIGYVFVAVGAKRLTKIEEV